MTLFQRGEFRLHSGGMSPWKIECDALTDEDLSVLAERASKLLKFGDVIGVPRGGTRFAQFLRAYAQPNGGALIVDDVLTTGKSMEEMRLKYPDAAGMVIFARALCPHWVTPLFRCHLS